MMWRFCALGTVTIGWVLWGYGTGFGNSLGGLGLVGNPFGHVGLQDLLTADAVMGPAGHQIPTLAFAAFQGTFAIIAVALVSGSIADRAKFSTWTVFTVVWATLVYFCLLYTSDAADERSSVDLGGRRIIKKKKNSNSTSS